MAESAILGVQSHRSMVLILGLGGVNPHFWCPPVLVLNMVSIFLFLESCDNEIKLQVLLRSSAAFAQSCYVVPPHPAVELVTFPLQTCIVFIVSINVRTSPRDVFG